MVRVDHTQVILLVCSLLLWVNVPQVNSMPPQGSSSSSTNGQVIRLAKAQLEKSEQLYRQLSDYQASLATEPIDQLRLDAFEDFKSSLANFYTFAIEPLKVALEDGDIARIEATRETLHRNTLRMDRLFTAQKLLHRFIRLNVQFDQAMIKQQDNNIPVTKVNLNKVKDCHNKTSDCEGGFSMILTEFKLEPTEVNYEEMLKQANLFERELDELEASLNELKRSEVFGQIGTSRSSCCKWVFGGAITGLVLFGFGYAFLPSMREWVDSIIWSSTPNSITPNPSTTHPTPSNQTIHVTPIEEPSMDSWIIILIIVVVIILAIGSFCMFVYSNKSSLFQKKEKNPEGSNPRTTWSTSSGT